MAYGNGSMYEGGWASGQKQTSNGSVGTFTFPDGSVYVGGWARGKMHGAGEIRFSNGDKFSGGFVDGKRDGQGTLEVRHACARGACTVVAEVVLQRDR